MQECPKHLYIYVLGVNFFASRKQPLKKKSIHLILEFKMIPSQVGLGYLVGRVLFYGELQGGIAALL